MEAPRPSDSELHGKIKKRMLMFYFAAGLNLVMAFWVFSASGSTQASGGTVTVIMLIFLLFAGLNYYMARRMSKQWNQYLRQQQTRE